MLLEGDGSSHPAHLRDQIAQRKVGHHVPVRERRVGRRRRVAREEPVRDGGALVGVAVGTDDRILHDLLGYRAHGRRNVAEGGQHWRAQQREMDAPANTQEMSFSRQQQKSKVDNICELWRTACFPSVTQSRVVA